MHFKARTRLRRWSTALLFSYGIAHEAHHRSQIEMALLPGGQEPGQRNLYARWDWTKLAPADPTE